LIGVAAIPNSKFKNHLAENSVIAGIVNADVEPIIPLSIWFQFLSRFDQDEVLDIAAMVL
jgi:hypothetical protein